MGLLWNGSLSETEAEQFVTLAEELCADVVALARKNSPREICGLLLARSANALTAIHEWRLAPNLSTDQARFLIDPRFYREIERGGERGGRSIVGLVHSHPHGWAEPSLQDLAAARRIWEESSDWIYLICGLKESHGQEIRAWKLSGGRFCELSVQIEKNVGEFRPGYSPSD